MAKAATRLHVTPPAVSQAIFELEQTIGVRLFDRGARGVVPTLYGHALLKGGTAAFDDLKQALLQIKFLADPTVGEVKIGCPEVVAVLLPAVIQTLTQRHPGIVVHTSDVSAPTLDLPQLRDRSLDLAIVPLAGPPSGLHVPDDFNVDVLFHDETLVVVGQRSPWARRRKLEIGELAGEPWILPPLHTLNTTVVMDAFRAARIDAPKVNLVTFSIQLRVNLAADGPYVTVLPRSMLHLYGFRLPLKALPIKLPSREWPVAMVTLKNKALNPIAMLFAEHLRAGLKTLAS
jgi:DNA-binding transcriptional LysR family regulator